jgi:hypothetical protein
MTRCAITFIVLALGFAGWSSAQRFTVHPDEIVCDGFIGFGAEFSPFVTAPNLGQAVGDIDDLQRKLIALRPQHVRIFVLTQWWTQPDPAQKNSFIRTVELAQKAGASVNVTLWYGWLNDPAAAARVMGQLLSELIRDRHLTCVQYVTLQNEVNLTKITMEQYDDLYKRFDAELRKIGLRDRIKIVGGDLLGQKRKEWIENLSTVLGDICDGYSVHTYWEYSDWDHPLKSTSAMRQIMGDLTPKNRRPVFLTEFGIRGQGWQKNPPGLFEGKTPMLQTTIHGEHAARMMMLAVNHGYVATVFWEAYDVFYDKPMHCGVLGEPAEAFPVRPTYHLLRMFTHGVDPGWSAVRVDGATNEQYAAVMCGPQNTWTIFAHNRADEPVTIFFDRLPEVRFDRIIWNADGRGMLNRGDEVTVGKFVAAPHTVTALVSDPRRARELIAASSSK